MIHTIKRYNFITILQGYWLISPLVILLYLYLTTLNLHISFVKLLNEAPFAFSFLNACIAFTQSYWLKMLDGKNQKHYLILAFVQQLVSLNVLGAGLSFLSLKQTTYTSSKLPKAFFILGCAVLCLSILVSGLLLIQIFHHHI